MKIKYDNTLDDLMALQHYAFKHSEDFLKQKKRLTLYVPLLFCVAWLVLIAETMDSQVVIYGGLFIVLYVFFSHFEYRVSIYKRAKKILLKQNSPGALCEHTLEIEDEYLIEKTAVNETKTRWSGLYKIVENDNHGFIFLAPLQAHIIPKERITEGNYEEFLAAARSHFQSTQETKQIP